MRQTQLQYMIIGALLTAIAVAAIWFATQTNRSVDVTANNRHALTPETVLAVQALQGPVDILAVLGPDETQREALRTLVSRYQAHNPLLTLTFINPETDPERVRALNAAPSGELIVQGMGREQRLNSVSERALTGVLRQLNREGERQIQFTQGHDERMPNDTGANHFGTLSQRLQSIGLNSSDVSLVTQPRLADELDLLVIADARRPFFPGEVAAVLEHVNRGGNLLWLIETDLNKETGPKLNALALELGIEIFPGLIIDAASQQLNAGSPTFVILDSFASHPVTQGIRSPLLLPQARALAVTPLAGQTLLPLLQTPEASWSETGELAGAVQFDENTNETRGPLVVGVTIERSIAGRQQRIAVIGDADFASNQFIANGANLAFAESLMLWLTGDADALAFVTQPAPDARLNLSPQNIIVLSVALLVALPILLFLTAGILAWRRRR
jgi:ABC-type uncharacterized transport system involved in gliding motility auxiliary subunit